MRVFLIFIVLLLISPGHLLAIGGGGASCNPNESGWGTCTLSRPSWDSFVTNSISIPSGNYATPFLADQANTEYTLQGNVTADSTAILISKDYIIINLNGYTITYNETTAGEGVTISDYNVDHSAILNGTILQGAADSEGDQYGSFNNPVGTCYNIAGNCRSATFGFIANLYVKYTGRDISGIKWIGTNVIVTECTVEDDYEFGTLKNRAQGVDAIKFSYGFSTATNNTIINARQRGINVGDAANGSTVHGNKIGVRSIGVNSYGIFGYKSTNVTVYSNTITARGEHPLGIGFVSDGTDDIEIYDNYIDSMVTRLGTEYGGGVPGDSGTIYSGLSATGFRTTWGGDNINFHDNEIHVTANSDYTGTYSPDGTVCRIKSGAKGIWAGILEGETALFQDNIVYALDDNGTTETYGLDCSSNHSDGISFLGNTVTSNVNPLVIGESYGACDGYILVKGNTFIQQDAYAGFVTISNQLEGFYSSKAKIVDNTYQGGAAATDIDFEANNDGTMDIYFGHGAGGTNYFDYRWHDNNNMSAALIKEEFDPAILFPGEPPAETRLEVLTGVGLKVLTGTGCTFQKKENNEITN